MRDEARIEKLKATMRDETLPIEERRAAFRAFNRALQPLAPLARAAQLIQQGRDDLYGEDGDGRV